MEGISVTSVVFVSFPFSDLSNQKLRPALVMADVGKGDWILCQITSKAYADPEAIKLEADDFVSGGLGLTSYARPGKVFTAHSSLVKKNVGMLTNSVHRSVVDSLCKKLSTFT